MRGGFTATQRTARSRRPPRSPYNRFAMRLALALASLAALASGCRESVERGFIYYPAPEMVADPGSAGLTFRTVEFVTADGLRLHGWLVPGRLPTTILWCHGNAGNISHRVGKLEMLVRELGVGVFLFDYRGYGRSEGVPTEAGLVRDAVAARAALLREGAPPGRLVYLGESLGAAVAIDLALGSPPLALVLEAPFASIPAMAHRVLPGSGLFVKTRWDSLSKAPQLRAPVLIVHGEADQVVPIAQAQSLFGAIATPKTFVAVAGAGHNDLSWSREYRDALKEFLRGK